VPVFVKVRDTETLVPAPMDVGTDWDVKEESSAADADPAASSATAASPAATTVRGLMERRIEELLIEDRWPPLAGDDVQRSLQFLAMPCVGPCVLSNFIPACPQ